jgi:hypothetical protein
MNMENGEGQFVAHDPGFDSERILHDEEAQKEAARAESFEPKKILKIFPSKKLEDEARAKGEAAALEYAEKNGIEIADDEMPADVLEAMESYSCSPQFQSDYSGIFLKGMRASIESSRRVGPVRERRNSDGTVDYLMTIEGESSTWSQPGLIAGGLTAKEIGDQKLSGFVRRTMS